MTTLTTIDTVTDLPCIACGARECSNGEPRCAYCRTGVARPEPLEAPRVVHEWTVEGVNVLDGHRLPFRYTWRTGEWDDPEAEARNFLGRPTVEQVTEELRLSRQAVVYGARTVVPT